MSKPHIANNRTTDDVEILDPAAIGATVTRLAEEIVARFGADGSLCLVGVRRRGDELARRLAAAIERAGHVRPPCGALDITLYRDDFDSLTPEPIVAQSDIPFALEGRTVVLVDDVLYTGRTARAALDELLDLGRPARVVLVVLVDRGWRELPIAADLAGRVLETAREDDIQVLLCESDGRETVLLRRRAEEEGEGS
ncbi:MAG TPA: bifunctional pyr operon transcriptional regulator/uracil phosphoribosyltransferase PyrR [Thermomicrobiaceae bacterium]|nr:bifunctional pyr operon transcriptional regulator/uracil phosphoribosyltransferase PyrR [Thermomicrobiaceae bacterium]